MKVLHLLDEPYDSGLTAYALAAAAGSRGRGQEHFVAALEGLPPFQEARRLGLEPIALRGLWTELARLRRVIQERGISALAAHTGRAHTLCVAAAAGLPVRVVRVRADARCMRPRPLSGLLWSRTAGFIAANRIILGQARPLLANRPYSLVYQGLADPGPAQPAPEGPRVVGILGRLDPVKGHAVFLEAARLLLRSIPDISFKVAGREENVKIAGLQARAREFGIFDRVEFLGHAPDSAAFMRSCHVGVIASLGSEAVSRAAVEWLACGRPLAASCAGCLPEYLEGCEGARIAPCGDAGALCEALQSLLKDRPSWERASHAARARYEERFTLDRFLDGFDGLLRRACA
ncbi:MAG: glycosyltransferase [Elusimicrobiota bacterium]|jgi:glycosyltransferase involved in cell wall biosynthesis